VLPPDTYAPTWVELGLVGGMFGVVAFLILMFIKVFPIVPTPHPLAPDQRPERDWRRGAAAALTALTAVGLIALGLSDSFRMWSGREIDPRIPFSPAIFATGVILLFSSAIVYEAFPARRRTPLARASWRRSAGVRRVHVRPQLRSSRDRGLAKR
jgi:hypothetical protein